MIPPPPIRPSAQARTPNSRSAHLLGHRGGGALALEPIEVGWVGPAVLRSPSTPARLLVDAPDHHVGTPSGGRVAHCKALALTKGPAEEGERLLACGIVGQHDVPQRPCVRLPRTWMLLPLHAAGELVPYLESPAAGVAVAVVGSVDPPLDHAGRLWPEQWVRLAAARALARGGKGRLGRRTVERASDGGRVAGQADHLLTRLTQLTHHDRVQIAGSPVARLQHGPAEGGREVGCGRAGHEDLEPSSRRCRSSRA
mmetsp:Transcript_35441/g.112895  ORF Transcript_35441/g.112895 Transcript_35441/m.112895 type:complete len:255 (-) Transcript_35441:248-1012(-)